MKLNCLATGSLEGRPFVKKKKIIRQIHTSKPVYGGSDVCGGSIFLSLSFHPNKFFILAKDV